MLASSKPSICVVSTEFDIGSLLDSAGGKLFVPPSSPRALSILSDKGSGKNFFADYRVIKDDVVCVFNGEIYNYKNLCEKYDINSKISKTKFDYSLFTSYQGKMLDIDLKITKKNQAKLTRLEINDAILEEINLQLGTNLDFDNDFKSLEITTGNEITDWGLNNSILDSNDIIILNDFVDTILANGVEVALVELENNVLQNNMDLSPTKIQKYEELANTVKLINAEDPELFDNNLQSKNCI